jgi:hypothetical protein
MHQLQHFFARLVLDSSICNSLYVAFFVIFPMALGSADTNGLQQFMPILPFYLVKVQKSNDKN